MARVVGLLPAALNAVRAGMTASGFIRELRSQGLGARDVELRSLFRMAQSIVAKSPDDPFADQNAVPTDRPLTPWPTKSATGIKQVVTLIYRDKTTGVQLPTYYNIVSPQGVAREAAVAKAISAYSSTAEQYKQEFIGAVHTGAYILQPFTVSE